MTDRQQREAAASFADRWRDRGSERAESQTFWLELLQDVMGVEHPSDIITFEEKVHIDTHNGFIDGYIRPTHVLIEQKGRDRDLREPIRQSDGTMLNPFQQAKRYSADLPYSERPRWVLTCNFHSFLIYDMETPNGEPQELLLENLGREYHRLSFLVDAGSERIRNEREISIKAGDLIGRLYDKFLEIYGASDPETLRQLNILCVRLVFCLYAEDAGVFGRKDMFHDFLVHYEAGDLSDQLEQLFRTLDTPVGERKKFLRDALKEFPYVNGGLFHEELEVPPFTPELKDLLLQNASEDFDWSRISPTIFGALFESTLNPNTRRNGGMHYTSIENIHKVIDPLFLDGLRAELEAARAIAVPRAKRRALVAFQEHLASLRFLDPACGSGNFLTETYLSLRRLENEAIRELHNGQVLIGFDEVDPIRVSIHQFYGIEINDFAVTVATTALWIAEAQMMQETEIIINRDLEVLPLRAYTNIREANALRIDWNDVVPASELSYIMGNPPFVGARLMSDGQKDDLLEIFGKKWKNVGNLDYVSCWFKKATDYTRGTSIRSALVSTNSITQGEQVATLWKPLFSEGLQFDFAYRTFRWDSEASLKAHVHCVIIGFSHVPCATKYIFTGEQKKEASNINGYLVDGPSVFIDSRSKPIVEVPEMVFGSMPNDGGYLSDYSVEEKNEITSKYPAAAQLFRRLLGATEFINNRERWCLWLKGVSPSIIRSIPPIFQAVESVRKMRLESSRESTRILADTPALFGEIRQPETDYLLIPRTTSERRRYLPIGFEPNDVVSNDANLLIPNATPYHFGIMASNVHNAWMRAVCGRLKSDYRYSAKTVYNNFPWPTPTDAQRAKIEQTAQAILDARALYPASSLADLYDEAAMPPELRRAHQENDRAVMEAYAFPIPNFTESDCVARLLEMYRNLTS